MLTPVLFIGGENDVIIDAVQSAQRLTRLIPSAGTKLIPDCGHVVFNALEYIMPFLTKGGSA